MLIPCDFPKQLHTQSGPVASLHDGPHLASLRVPLTSAPWPETPQQLKASGLRHLQMTSGPNSFWTPYSRRTPRNGGGMGTARTGYSRRWVLPHCLHVYRKRAMSVAAFIRLL